MRNCCAPPEIVKSMSHIDIVICRMQRSVKEHLGSLFLRVGGDSTLICHVYGQFKRCPLETEALCAQQMWSCMLQMRT